MHYCDFYIRVWCTFVVFHITKTVELSLFWVYIVACATHFQLFLFFYQNSNCLCIMKYDTAIPENVDPTITTSSEFKAIDKLVEINTICLLNFSAQCQKSDSKSVICIKVIILSWLGSRVWGKNLGSFRQENGHPLNHIRNYALHINH